MPSDNHTNFTCEVFDFYVCSSPEAARVCLPATGLAVTVPVAALFQALGGDDLPTK
jgi:hypothetical protein